MKTFSQAPTETNQLGDIINVLNILPDNTTKLISPKDVRDAVYTLWENTMFKPTSFTGSVDYIGIDQYQLKDDNEADWYPKVYFGKKQTGGQFIMNNDLLTQPEVDFFFYNTKNNSIQGNYETSIAILSGTGPFYNTTQNEVRSPQIVSTPVSDQYGQYMDLTIKNTSYNNDGTDDYGGNINIRSEKGYVSVNDFFFPSVDTIQDTTAGYILSLEKDGDGNAFGVWRSPFSQSISNIITKDPFTINAPSITLNGYKFTDSTIVATGIGGIKAGESFTTGVDVLDMIRRIVYTYVAPRVTSLLTTETDPFTQVKLIETGDGGTWTSLRLRASVIKNATQSLTDLGYLPGNNLIPAAVAINPFPSSLPTIGNTTTNAIYQPEQSFNFDPVGNDRYKIITFTLSVSDNYPTTNVASSTIKTVYPYFYGTATYAATQSAIPGATDINNILGINITAPAGKLKPYLAEPIIGNPTFSDNQYLKITTRGLPGTTGEGKGFIYFGFPAGNPLLKFIYDNSSLDVTTTFKTYSITINSPTSNPKRWSGRPYIFYISTETRVDLSTGTFSFIFT